MTIEYDGPWESADGWMYRKMVKATHETMFGVCYTYPGGRSYSWYVYPIGYEADPVAAGEATTRAAAKRAATKAKRQAEGW